MTEREETEREETERRQRDTRLAQTPESEALLERAKRGKGRSSVAETGRERRDREMTEREETSVGGVMLGQERILQRPRSESLMSIYVTSARRRPSLFRLASFFRLPFPIPPRRRNSI
jgi:hypothetical protein